MPGDNVMPFPQRGPEKLSPTLQKIQDMKLNYTDAEYHAHVGQQSKTLGYDPIVTTKLGEDSVLGALKTLVKVFFQPKGSNKLIGPEFVEMIRIVGNSLSRDEAIQSSENTELFREALAEIKVRARKFDFNI